MNEASIIKAFNYIVVRMAVKYACLKHNISEDNYNERFNLIIEKFNQDNNFNYKKLTLMPLLLTVCNGHKRQLISFFMMNFIPNHFGIIHRFIDRILKNSIVNPNPDLLFSWVDNRIVINDIEAARHLILTGVEELEQIGDIEISIQFMHSRRIKNFALLNDEDMSYYSKNIVAYKNYYSKPLTENSTVDFLVSLINETNEFEPSEIKI